MRCFCFLVLFVFYALAQEISEQVDPLDKVVTPATFGHYYASFGFNLIYAHFYHQHYFNARSFNSLAFAFDVGRFVQEDRFFIGFYLDGATGGGNSDALYAFFSGVKIGGRFWDQKAIYYFKIGANLMHFPFEYKQQQFNIYGIDSEIGVFFDIERGYGVGLSYRHTFNKAYKLPLSNIHTSIVMLGFAYYDFSLDW